jgi:hypothetical protein
VIVPTSKLNELFDAREIVPEAVERGT